MFGNSRLFGFPLIKESDYIEIGGGEGDLSLDLKNRGFNIILFIEPEIKKFEIASKKLKGTLCLNIDAENLIDNFNQYSNVIIIFLVNCLMQFLRIITK